MERPAPGYYRKLLPMYPDVRIAFTHTPIIGCTIVDNAGVLAALKTNTDPYAQYYANGLTNGTMVTIVENACVKTWANNGELFFCT